MTRKTTIATDALTAGIEASIAAAARTAGILKDFSKATDDFAGRYDSQEDQRVAEAVSRVVSDALVAFYHNNFSTTRSEGPAAPGKKGILSNKAPTPWTNNTKAGIPIKSTTTKTTLKPATARDDLRVLVTLSQEALLGPREDSFALRALLIQKINTLTLKTILAVSPTMKGWAIKTADLTTRDLLLQNDNIKKIQEIFHGIRVAVPEEWFNYVVPLVPSAFHGVFGQIDVTRDTVIEEALAQTGETPIRCDISRHGANAITGKASWIISFKKKVKPFYLFTTSTRARVIDNKPRITRHSPGCQGWCNPIRCTKVPLCETCGLTQEKHSGPMGPDCGNQAKCANCHGPHNASHNNCPARPRVKEGKIIKPTKAEIATIRQASYIVARAARTSEKSKDSAGEIRSPSLSGGDSSPGGADLDAALQSQLRDASPLNSAQPRGTKRPRGQQVTEYENAGTTSTDKQPFQDITSSRRTARETRPQDYNLRTLSRNSITPGGLQGSRFSALDQEVESATRPAYIEASDEEMDFVTPH